MSVETFQKIVHVWSRIVPDLQPHQDVLAGFIYLIENIDGLPNIERRFHREGLSFYHAISKNRSMDELKEMLAVFFGGQPLIRAESTDGGNPQGVSAERLGGVQGEQVMFVKTFGEAEFYGALWPWKDKKDVITVHLGLCAPSMTEQDQHSMYAAMMGHLTETASVGIEADAGGRVSGISLSSFLQISELEKSTCSLSVRAGEKTGALHLLNGNLIDAETGSLKHREAAYAILGWVDVEIEIQKPSGRKKNEINLSMTSILTDALKKKDESDFASGASEPEPVKDAAKEAAPTLEKESASSRQTATTTDQRAKKGRSQDLGGDGKAANAPHKTRPPKVPGAGKKMPIGRKRRWLPVGAGVVVALLAFAAVFWYLQAGSGGMGGDDFAALLQRLESVTDDAEKEKLLNSFIESHANDPVATDKAMPILFEVLNRVEASDYEKTVRAVFDLPLDRQYFQKAEEIFNDFLLRYPDSPYNDDIEKRLMEISALTDDAHFSELNELGPRDYLGRLEACNGYLHTHPEGKHREAVKQFARETLEASYREFSINIDRCKRRKKWDHCMDLIRQYRESFQPYMNMAAVDQAEAQVLELKALDVLKTATEDADDETVRRLYTEFLNTYPDSTEKRRLEERVAEIDRMRSAPDEWMRVEAAGRDTSMTLSQRMELLRRYIDGNPGGAYLTKAQILIAELEQEAQNSTPGKAVADTARAVPPIGASQDKPVPADLDRVARLKGMQQEMSDVLAKTGSRFAVEQNGTVLDTTTGLAWTLLDSLQVSGHCMNYRQAEAYVQQLNDGSRSDWRLPTSAELAGIYQNSPYFPTSGSEWYWSSEVYEKGYQTIANIVHAEPEAVYKKRTAGVRKCGSVRAVRP